MGSPTSTCCVRGLSERRTPLPRAPWMPARLAALDNVRIIGTAGGGQSVTDKPIGPSHLDEISAALADFVDLASPFTRGHSTRVAKLAEAAALNAGLGGEDAATVRRAGQVHDLGMVSVPNRVWIKHGSLNQSEWERVRLPDRTRAPGRPGHCAHSRHQPLRQDRRQHASRGNAFRLRERPDRLTIAMTGRPNGGYRRSL